MNNDNMPGPRADQMPLARWLQQLFTSAPNSEVGSTPRENEAQLDLLLTTDYHPHFYQQLPDFVMALLTNDAQATLRYAPLLYHLLGCSTCHLAYVDLYDALQAAVYPTGVRPLLGQGTRTLAATPQRMLAHLCQSLISQAQAVLLQARHEHADQDATARSLLQLALHISAHITQSTVRRQALHNLVPVATLFDGPSAPAPEDPNLLAFTPLLTPTSSQRRSKVLRRSELLSRADNKEQPVIELQARNLLGYITQQDQMLMLHLRDLDPGLRGHYLSISILLGSLLEPVRWLGGNPRAIRSSTPVDASGVLVTPLGSTEMLLSNPEERNLLEALFMLLEVRPID